MTHTPGPWKVKDGYIQGAGYPITPVDRVYDMKEEFQDEHKANLNLLASAPSLLAALEAMMECLHETALDLISVLDYKCINTAAIQALGAIREAKGE